MAALPIRLSVYAGSLVLVLFLALLAERSAEAREPLRPFPAEVLRIYATVVNQGEIAVVESEASGRARQITLLGYAAAPPALTYGLVADPLLYPRYVRNLTRSDVEKQVDGSMLNRWTLSFPIGTFEGTDEVRLMPPAPEAATQAVEIRSLGEGKEGIQRWEFLPIPGGGTLVVNYGYYDPLDNAFLRVMIGKDPALDAGFNLAGGLAVLRNLLIEAGREAQQAGTAVTAAAAPKGTMPDFGPLLNRGTVAMVRSGTDGSFQNVSVIERVPAPAQRMETLLRDPENWPSFMRTVKKVTVTQRDAQGLEYDMSVAGMMVDVDTTFRMLFVPGGIDTLAISGAVKGARFRWDLRPDGPQHSVVVWRGNLHMADSSRLLRTMLRIEPSFEHSANITVGLISVRSLAAQALR
jgi:ribosome-associated toxin RatA of RatAB toxin-antitoxin module